MVTAEQSVAPDTPGGLLERIRDDRDAESWETFVAVYAPLVYRWARHRGLPEADAADIAQEVLLQAGRSAAAPAAPAAPAPGRFREWLGALTHARVAHFLDQKARAAAAGGLRGPSLAAPAAGEAAEWEAEFNARVLRAAMDRARQAFAPTVWGAFERQWLAGLTPAAAAHELGAPIDAVFVARAQVLQRLRQEVHFLAGDLGAGPPPERESPP
jgi:RNA polymerase sigma-70 factor (ECF subfamily)